MLESSLLPLIHININKVQQYIKQNNEKKPGMNGKTIFGCHWKCMGNGIETNKNQKCLWWLQCVPFSVSLSATWRHVG